MAAACFCMGGPNCCMRRHYQPTTYFWVPPFTPEQAEDEVRRAFKAFFNYEPPAETGLSEPEAMRPEHV